MKVLAAAALLLATTTALGCAASSSTQVAPVVSTKTTTTTIAVVDAANANANTNANANASVNTSYETVDVGGFTAHLAPAAQRHPKRQEVLATLAARLTNLQSAFPPASRDDLRRTTPLWLTERTSSGPLFHADTGPGDKAQLPKPELGNGIEIPSITLLLELFELRESKTQDVLAMSLAASYFMHLSAPPWKEAEEAFVLAKTNLMTAKIGADPLSYFSALSAAYFGRWSLPPDRAALRAADPRGVDLVARTWHLPAERAVAQR